MKQPKLTTFVGEEYFATALAQHIFSAYYDTQNPASLANLSIFLPTRRACQALKHQLFKQYGGQNLILPKITTISDLNLLDYLPINHPFWQTPPQKIIGKQMRLFMVAQYLFTSSKTHPQLFLSNINFAQSLEYAKSFIALRDDFLRANITLQHLHEAIIGDYAEHWFKSLELFQMVMNWLDNQLKQQDLVEAITYQSMIINQLSDYWQQNPHPNPIIAAGSTGSTLNTAKLLKAIYQQPKGCLVLRELDIWSDEADFNNASPINANYNLKQLLHKIGATRNDVVQLHAGTSKRGEIASIVLHQRNKLHETKINFQDLQGIKWLECENDFVEAQSICLHIRHALSSGVGSIIVISDDDALNMRLKTMLEQVNITVDISAGIAAHHDSEGNFMLLVASVLYGEYNSANLLSLMRHPICCAHHANMNALAEFMEKNMLRGLHPYQKLHDVLQDLAQKTLPPELQNAQNLMAEIAAIIAPVTAKMPLQQMIELHQQIWLLLSVAANNEYNAILAQTLQLITSDIICTHNEYITILQQQFETLRHVSPPLTAHVTIIGLLELRLQVADYLIMPRANEGTFPSSPPPDPWLNHDLRAKLGLDYDMRKIGLASHDMAIMLRFKQILFTRALKEKNSYTRSSRLFERLKLLMNKYDIPCATYLLEWVKQINHTQYQPILKPPPINPPLHMRPHKISATMMEKFFSNPFDIFASHICKLRELEPLDSQLQPKDFGQALHSCLHQAASFYHTLQYEHYLSELFDNQLKTLMPNNEAQFFHARLERILQALKHEENLRHHKVAAIETEVKYATIFTLEGGTKIELNSRIDRIENLHDGGCIIIDYKTGSAPKANAVKSFEKCQLLVCKLILESLNHKVEDLQYWDLSGKISNKDSIIAAINPFTTNEIAAIIRSKLTYFIEDEGAIYYYSPSKNQTFTSAIDHFARLGEYY
jgi:ATP-dependent helicase/nuclease subunit B